jgi:hypothetical protein
VAGLGNLQPFVRDHFYRIAFLLGVAALAVLFGSAAWILGRGINMAAANKAPQIQVVTLEQRQDRLDGLSPVATRKGNLIAAQKSVAEPTKPLAKLATIEARVVELPAEVINAIPEVTETLLGTPQKLAPWLDDVAIIETPVSANVDVQTTTRVPIGSPDTRIGASVSGLGMARAGVAAGIAGKVGGIASRLSGKVGKGRI